MHVMRRGGVLTLALVAFLALAAAPAGAAVVIGSNLTSTANNNTNCNSVDCTIVNLSLGAGQTAPGGLTSPVNGTVTSWSFKSNSASGNPVSLRILTQVSGTTFTGAGTSGSVPDAAGIVGPNPTSLPIKAGDFIGLNGNSELFEASGVGGATQAWWTMPQLVDGTTRAAGGSSSTTEVLVQATIEPTANPSNTVTFGTAVLHKKKGTATLPVSIPGPGTLTYGGAGVKVSGPTSVSSAGAISLTISATGKKRKKLRAKGKVAISVSVTFTPTNGTANTQSDALKLKRKLKK
jgi:hypothetical protein